MNFRISLVLLSAVVATAAYANRATDNNFAPGDAGFILGTGSLVGDDTRNMFYNPAYINNSKNWAVIEKASDNTAGAEGGFVANMMNFNLGLYMGRNVQNDMMRKSSGAGSTVAAGAPGYSAATSPVRSFEVLGGMDLGTAKLGLGVSHASVSNVSGTASDINVNVGASVMGFEPFAGFKVVGKDPGAGGATSKHNYMRFGVRYVFGEWTPFAAVAIGKDVTVPGTSEYAQTNWGLGFARNMKLADGVKVGYSLAYFRGEDKDNVTTTIKVKRQAVPVTVSAEADATSWLTVRAGIDYRLMDKVDSASYGENTTGRIGAGLHLGKADFDFVVGNAAASTENFDSKTFDFSNSLFSAASLTYHW